MGGGDGGKREGEREREEKELGCAVGGEGWGGDGWEEGSKSWRGEETDQWIDG